MKKYVFRKYNPIYAKFFEMEKKRLQKLLGSSAKIEHVGSTAIQNLGGKGILDILIGVSKNRIQKSRMELEKTDYEFREKAGSPERFFFEKDYLHKRGKRRVHIHLTPINSREWKQIISFRNWLRKHPEVIKEYVKIKKAAVKKARGDGEVYRKCKEKFIASVLEKALRL